MRVVVWTLAMVLAQGAGAGIGNAAEGAKELRRAWVLHRLEGRADEAFPLYQAVHEDPKQAADVRCRAAIGLGLLYRDRGQERKALHWFETASKVPDAGARWVRSALDERTAVHASLESESDPGRPLRELEQQVGDLERDLALFRRLIQERDEALGRRDAVIQRLQARKQGEQRALGIQVEMSRSRASLFLEGLEEQEREASRVTRYVVRTGLNRSREHLAEGRVLFAYNEVKRVLELDSRNREAQELSGQLRSLMAQGVGQRSLEHDARVIAASTHPDLVIEVMTAYLQEGKRLFRDGKIVGAIRAFERVIEEYAQSPIALTDEQVSLIVSPAEYYLRVCFEDRGVGAEARKLQARRSDLLAAVQEGAGRILDQEQALEQIDSSLAEIREQSPEAGLRRARDAIEEQMRKGLDAMGHGSHREARLSFGDVLLLLEWFPTLDPDQLIRKEVAGLLGALHGPVPSPDRQSP